MHVLYVDDSGSPDNPNDKFFVLGGISVFERGIYHLIKAADDLVATFSAAHNLGPPDDVELHGSHMYSGRGVWHRVKDRPTREGMIAQALVLLTHQSSVSLFAVIVDRQAASPRDPVELAFEEICNRFNLFLNRANNRERNHDNTQRGLIVMDETKHEEPLQALARHFRLNGARWGKFRNLAEVPLFVNSKASRLVQLADLVAHATFRKYEYSDGRLFDPILPKFDAEGGVIHGLVHYRDIRTPCYCPACMSRTQQRLPFRSGGVGPIMPPDTPYPDGTEQP